MSGVEIWFWAAAGLVVYTYLVYPLWMGLLARLWRRPIHLDQPFTGSVSIVLAAHNEERHIDRRLEELSGLLAASGRDGEIVVVSDGSTDATVVLAKAWTKGSVHVVELPDNAGKAAALTRGCAAARGDVVVFADVRQTWAPDALEKLLRNFADPAVGAVSGELIVESAPGVMAGVGLYWRYEKWLRRQESAVYATVGVTGAISAVRRCLFEPIPSRTLLDDVYWPLKVAMQGSRVIYEDGARAYDRLPENARDEFRRKVRTLSGNFQLVSRLPAALLPWRNPVWFALVSHKILRLLVPWGLLTMLVLAAMLEGPVYRQLLMGQLFGYGLALLGLWPAFARRCRPASAAASCLVLNAAAWLAFWVWASGKAARSWHKVLYKPAPTAGMETR